MSDNNKQAGQSRGNRPADNALHATPASLAGQMNWQGDGAAEDFLGLNEESAPSAPPAPPAPALPNPVAQAIQSPLSQTSDESWLLGGEAAEEASQLEPALEESSEHQGEEHHPDEGEVFVPAVLDASWTEPGSQTTSRKRPMLVAAGVIVIVGAAAGIFFKPASHVPRESSPATELARAPVEPDSTEHEPVTHKPTPIEMPKPSGSAAGAAESNTQGRRAVDRAGHTAPNPIPVPLNGNSTPDSNTRAVPVEIAPDPPKATKKSVAAVVPHVAQPTPARPKFQPLKPAPLAPQESVAPTKDDLVKEDLVKADSAKADPAKADPAALAASNPPPVVVTAVVEPVQKQAPAPAPVPEPVAAPVAVPENPQTPVVDVTTKPETETPIVPRVQVIATSTAPLAGAADARPALDEHRSAVPTDVVPLPEVRTPTPQVAIDETAPVHPPSVISHEGATPTSDAILLPQGPLKGVRVAQAEDFMSVWNGDSVPLDRVDSKIKVMTPNVGKVRVTLKSKDVFEGTLYAVGENSVWIEGPFGRMGLDNVRVASVEKLAPDPKTAGASSANVNGAPGNARVRITTPSGTVYGHVISTDGLTTKVVTEAGIKLTVDAKSVEVVEAAPKVPVKKVEPVEAAPKVQVKKDEPVEPAPRVPVKKDGPND